MDQPNATPTRKVTAGGLASALTIVLVWALGAAGIDVPAEVASAITTIFGFAAAYLVPERS